MALGGVALPLPGPRPPPRPLAMVHSARAVRRARLDALRALVDTTHWLTIPQAAALVPAAKVRVRRYLSAHTLACPHCPCYRKVYRHGGPARRVLSPADVRELRAALVMRGRKKGS